MTTSKIEGKILADAFAVDQDRYVILLWTRVLVDSLALAEICSRAYNPYPLPGSYLSFILIDWTMPLTYVTQPKSRIMTWARKVTLLVLTTPCDEASLNQDHMNHQVTSTSPSTRGATRNTGENRMLLGDKGNGARPYSLLFHMEPNYRFPAGPSN